MEVARQRGMRRCPLILERPMVVSELLLLARTAIFPKRPESFEKTGSYFFKGLDTLGVRYERINVPYGAGSLRALYFPGTARG